MSIDQELAAAIYVLYAIDCIHWLKSGQTAMTRRVAGGWKTHVFRDDSFMLLGRMPVFVNPFDFRPSYLAGVMGQESATEPPAEHSAIENIPDTRLLTALSIFGAANLFIFLPALLLSGSLPAWWPLPLWIAISAHVGLGCELFDLGTGWRRTAPQDFWREYASILLNPVAALRSGDIVLSAYCRLGLQREMSS